MESTPIYVECENCGNAHRWIPVEVERELAGLRSQIRELTLKLATKGN